MARLVFCALPLFMHATTTDYASQGEAEAGEQWLEDASPFSLMQVHHSIAESPRAEAVDYSAEQRLMQRQLQLSRSLTTSDGFRLAALVAENRALREELAQWVSAGSTVAEREAKLVELIRRTNPLQENSSIAVVDGMAATLAPDGAPANNIAAFFSQSAQVVRTSVASKGIALGLVLTAGFVMFAVLLAVLPRQAKAADRDAARYIGGPKSVWAPILREAGFGRYTIEVSEIQVGGATAGGDVCVALQMGQVREVRTKAQEVHNTTSLLKFNEVFMTNVKKYEEKDKLVLWLVDRHGVEDARVAKLEMPAQELLRKVHHEHGEYFKFDLEPITHCWQSTIEKFPAHRKETEELRLPGQEVPHVAMRIRDVTNLRAPRPAS